MSRLALRLLGPPHITVEGRAVSTDRRKAVALLAYLAVEGGGHERDALAAFFWPDYDASAALAYLRRTLWEINQMVGPGFLQVDRRQAAVVEDASVWLDVRALARALADPDGEGLGQAVELYRGDFMAGFSLADTAEFDNWQRFQAEKWRTETGRGLERLSSRPGEQGGFEQALAYARQWVSLDPLHEPAHRRLMHLLALSGNRAAAVHQYAALRDALQSELGAAPEAETTALVEQIRAGDYRQAQQAASGTRAAEAQGATAPHDLAPSPSVAAVPPLHLPAPATPFLGRKRELAEIAGLLAGADCRLLTLVGPGGMGKTRLAIEAAAATGAGFAHGAWFVPLAVLESPQQVVPMLAESLEMVLRSSEIDIRQQVLDFLRQRRLLLVLDNLEHLLQDGLTDLLNDILVSASDIKILATSRTRLNLHSEQVYLLGGMATPPDGDAQTRNKLLQADAYSALVLFRQSARRVQPDFELDASNLETVAAICRRVGGMPLGIELAAGWMAVLPPEDILAEIDRSLDFLETDQADVPQRQRSLRGMLDGTMALLLPEERQVFRRLGLIRGSFSRQAAEQIAGASLKTLLSLVNKSILRRDASGRFEMHPVVAQYAAEWLRSDPALLAETEQRFTAYFLAYLEQHGRNLSGPQQKEAFDALQLEIEPIRWAWFHTVAVGRWQEANATIEPLVLLHHVRARFENSLSALLEKAIGILEQAPRSKESDLLRARIMALQAWDFSNRTWIRQFPEFSDFAGRALTLVREIHLEAEMGVALSLLAPAVVWKGDVATGMALIEESERYLRQRGDEPGLAITLPIRATLLQWLGRRQEARALAQESISLCRRLGNQLQLAHSLLALADIAVFERELETAAQLYAESQTIFESLGDLSDAANVIYQMADNHMHSGHYEAAIAAFEACRRLFLRLGDRFFRIGVLSFESLCAVRAGNMPLAWELRRACLQEAREEDERLSLSWSIWEMGELYRLDGDYESARRWYDDGIAHLRMGAFERGEMFYQRGLGDLALAQGQPGEAAAHFRRSLELAEMEDYRWGMSRALTGLGHSALASGDAPAAYENFQQALRLAVEWGIDQGLMLMAVGGLAATHMAQGDAEKALALAIFVQGFAATLAETKRILQPIGASAAASLSPTARAAAEQRGGSLTLSEVIARYSVGGDNAG